MHHFNTRAYLNNLSAATAQEYSYTRALQSGDWKTWQSEWHARLEELLGLPHIRAVAANAPLAARSTQLEEFEDYTREKLFVTTEPGIEIPCYLLLPKVRNGSLPLVLTPHGHGKFGKETYVGNYSGEEDKTEAVEGERDIALQAVAAGYAVIAPDVRAFNEMSRAEDFPQLNNSCAELQRVALMYGRTLIGERVHDMGRLIDYAATRPEIDTSRIAITGNSGGGTVSLFTAAIDPRITVAVPGSYFCTFFGSIVSLHHCPCNIVPGILQSGELYDVVGLIAPRPSLFVNGKEDPIFPIEHTRAAFAHVREIYKSMSQAEKCELYEGDGGHRYYKERVWSFVRSAFDATQ
jgi:dienelactone hydrolase